MEEAAFIDPKLFEVVIVPLLGVDGTSVIAISTPDEDLENYFTVLMDLKDPETDGDLFKTIRLGLACQKCVAAGVAAKCTHMAHLAPPWKSSSRQAKMRKIMEKNPQLFERENLGMISSDTQYVFSNSMINALHTAPLYVPEKHPCVVYTAIDPAGGGSQSDYAMASVMVEHGKYVILGLDSVPSCDPRKVDTMILDHFYGIRRSLHYRNAHIEIYVENNFGDADALRLALQLKEAHTLQPLHVATYDESKGTLGVRTTSVSKAGYVTMMRYVMADKNLRYGKEFICQKNTHAEEGETEQQHHERACRKIREAFESQLRSFKCSIQKPNNPEFVDIFKKTYSGKGHNRKDDLLMCVLMACYWSMQTRNDPRFLQQARQKGWTIH